ncbi:MAG: ribosome maturation factor RimP [Deinococcus sp.]|nr:ribosome maturation factor RimP [Deinococcus sp.]
MITAKIEQQLAKVLEPEGLELLEVTSYRQGRSTVLLARIDRPGAHTSLADCELASRLLSLELDRLDPISGPYRLDVESPGPRRPLRTLAHFQRFIGRQARVETPQGRFTGQIIAALGTVRFRLPSGEEPEVALADIRKANLLEEK